MDGILLYISDLFIQILWRIVVIRWHRGGIKIGIGAIHLDFLLVMDIMSAKPDQVVYRERTSECDAVAVVLKTTRKVWIVESRETLHQCIKAKKANAKKTQTLV